MSFINQIESVHNHFHTEDCFIQAAVTGGLSPVTDASSMTDMVG
jgi:hypothetical protein